MARPQRLLLREETYNTCICDEELLNGEYILKDDTSFDSVRRNKAQHTIIITVVIRFSLDANGRDFS